MFPFGNVVQNRPINPKGSVFIIFVTSDMLHSVEQEVTLSKNFI